MIIYPSGTSLKDSKIYSEDCDVFCTLENLGYKPPKYTIKTHPRFKLKYRAEIPPIYSVDGIYYGPMDIKYINKKIR